MSNEWYDHTNVPSTRASLSSATIRAEFDAVEAGFAKLPTPSTSANRLWFTNSGGTGVSTNAGMTFNGTTLALSVIVALTGAVSVLDSSFSIKDGVDNTKVAQFQAGSITAGQTRTYTLPDTSDTLVTLAAAQTLTNKTLTAPVLGGTVTGTYSLGGVPTINVATAVGGVWTAAAAWTLPAYTLGGTVTSNGQSFSGTIADLGTVTTADINGGTLDGVVIGGASAAAGNFTTVAISGAGVGGLTLSRTGSATNSHVGFTTTGGSVYAGNADGTSFAIDDDTDINTSPWARFNAAGLTLDSGGSDTAFFTDLNSDVATALTTAPTQFGTVTTSTLYAGVKLSATLGGVSVGAFGENNAGLTTVYQHTVYGGQASTTKSSAGRSLIEFYASQHDGANALANIAADGNVFGVRARVGGSDVALMIVDEDGDAWHGGGATFNGLVTSSGNIVSGHTAALSADSRTELIQAHGTTADVGLRLGAWTAISPARLTFTASDGAPGTIGTQVAVGSGSLLGRIDFMGSDGTNFIQAARIEVSVDGTPGVNDMPGSMVFKTTADGGSSASTRLTIAASGLVTVAGSATVSNGLLRANGQVSGGALSASAPISVYLPAGAYTDTATAGSGTVALGPVVAIAGAYLIGASNSSVTYTVAASLYVGGAPSNGGNVTITNAYALYSAAGMNLLAGNTRIGGTTAPTVALDVTGAALISTTLGVSGVVTVASGTATPAGGSTSARLLMGTTAGFGVYYGSGAPTVSAAQGSIYIRSDGSSTSTRLYVNTNGTTGWTNFTSAT